jgi:competence protein ComK
MKSIKEDYLMNEKTVLLMGEYVKNGRQWTRVIEGEETFLVKKRPIDLINRALLCLGSDFRAARKSSKYILGECHMCPIRVNCNLGVWLFPTKSYRDDHCIWFSLMHVKDSKSVGVRRTKVFLSYNHDIEIEMKEPSFKNKKNKAIQLRESMLRNSQSPLTFYLEPKKGIKIIEGPGVNRYELKK